MSIEKCSKEFCSCVHRVQVELGDVVELIMLDRGKYWNISNHPMHIHGQFLYVLAIGQVRIVGYSAQYIYLHEHACMIIVCRGNFTYWIGITGIENYTVMLSGVTV